jgi:isoamylase
MRNFHLALMLSQGVPLLQMGDEYGHTKGGNNNSWCHDDERNWFLWDQLEQQREDFYRFYRGMIQFRKAHPLLRRTRFFAPHEIEWHGLEPLKPDWDFSNLFFACTLIDPEGGQDLYVAFNAQDKEVEVTLPILKESVWRWVADTARPAPEDFYDEEKGPIATALRHAMLPFSAILLKKVYRA